MDLKFWSGIGLALVSLAPGLSDGLRIILAILGGALILVSMVAWIYRGLSGPMDTASELHAARRVFVNRAFAELPQASVRLLREMLISGRPTNVTDDKWRPLEAAGLVERDFVGPKGIKEELKTAVESEIWPPSRIASAQRLGGKAQNSVVKSETSRIAAYVHYQPQAYRCLPDSFNVSSVTDNGLGDFTISFVEALDNRTLVALPIGTTPPFTVVETSPTHVRVKFGTEPNLISIRFDSAGDVT